MSLLESQIASDAAGIFMDADQFGFVEAIQYVPGAQNAAFLAGTNPVRTINAVVQRMTPQPQMGTRQDVQPLLQVKVANDPALGIASTQIDYGGDTFMIAYRVGESPTSHPIKQARGSETNDPGCLYLET